MWLLAVTVCSVATRVFCAPQYTPLQKDESSSAPFSNTHVGGHEITPIPILNQSESQGLDGSFNYSYETGNGIRFSQSGYVKKVVLPRYDGDGLADNAVPVEQEVQVLTGSYSYTAPDGQVISLSYTADEKGFQPIGDHIPTAPPVPADILQTLQGNALSSDRTNIGNPTRNDIPPGFQTSGHTNPDGSDHVQQPGASTSVSEQLANYRDAPEQTNEPTNFDVIKP